MTAQQNQLALAQQLTARAQALCLGLEDGDAEILELVTPVTAELLKWWFVRDVCETRRINFHEGQKQAILNAIVAHEVLNAETLKDLYQQVAPEELLQGPRLRYLKEEGLPAFYYPDFLVRTANKIYLVETKAQGQINHPNVQRKLKAATAWCERINALDEEQRSGREWSYVLLGETMFYEWRDKGGRMAEMLEFARVRLTSDVSAQARLGF